MELAGDRLEAWIDGRGGMEGTIEAGEGCIEGDEELHQLVGAESDLSELPAGELHRGGEMTQDTRPAGEKGGSHLGDHGGVPGRRRTRPSA